MQTLNLYINSRINFIKNVNLLYEKVEKFDIMYSDILNERWRLKGANFDDAERHIASLLSAGNEFTMNGKSLNKKILLKRLFSMWI